MARERTYDAEEIRPNRWLTALAASPFALIVPLLVLAALTHPALAVATVHLSIIGTLASVYVRRKNPWPRKVPVRVRVSDDALTIEDVGPPRGLSRGRHPSLAQEPASALVDRAKPEDRGRPLERIARAEITRGVFVPSGGESHVRLRRERKRDRDLTMRDALDASELLSDLGLGVEQTTASFRGMARTYASGPRLFGTTLGLIFATVLASAAASVGVTPIAGPFVMVTGMIALLVLTLWPSRIDVGADGVLVHWLGRERFVSHADIENVSIEERGFGNSRRRLVLLALRSGETLNVPTGAASWDAGSSEMLAARILEARDAYEKGDVSPHALLRRDGRPAREWVRALRAREVTSLRSAAVPKEHLWRVIEDTSAEPSERAAAVVALGPQLGRAERARLAKTAKVTAAPKLRVVLESAPEAADDEIAEMIEELEANRASPARAPRRAG